MEDEAVESLASALRTRSKMASGGSDRAMIYRMRFKGVTTRGQKAKAMGAQSLAQVDADKMLRIGRALTKKTHLDAFDAEQEKRKRIQALAAASKSAQKLKRVVPKDDPKTELRMNAETIERASLLKMNRQLGKRLISQREKMEVLKERHHALVLDRTILLNDAQEKDRQWKKDGVPARVAKNERKVLLMHKSMAKLRKQLADGREGINEDRRRRVRRLGMIADAQADICRMQDRCSTMGNAIAEDLEEISLLETEIHDMSAELGTRKGQFTSAYKTKRAKFEANALREQAKRQTFEQFLQGNFQGTGADGGKNTSKSILAVMEASKVERKKNMLHLTRRRVRVLENFFKRVREISGLEDVNDISAAIIESDQREFSLIRQVQLLNSEIDDLSNSIKEEHQRIARAEQEWASPKLVAKRQQAKKAMRTLAALRSRQEAEQRALQTRLAVIESMQRPLLDLHCMLSSKDRRRRSLLVHTTGPSYQKLKTVLGEVDLLLTTLSHAHEQSAGRSALGAQAHRRARGHVGGARRTQNTRHKRTDARGSGVRGTRHAAGGKVSKTPAPTSTADLAGQVPSCNDFPSTESERVEKVERVEAIRQQLAGTA